MEKYIVEIPILLCHETPIVTLLTKSSCVENVLRVTIVVTLFRLLRRGY